MRILSKFKGGQMKALSLAVCLIVIAGCGAVEPFSARGPYLTYYHGGREAAFKEAFDDAQVRCDQKEKGSIAAQTSTVCPDRCITNFECVKK